MMFSATLSLRVMELAYEHLNDAVKIEIRPEQVTADRVTQALYHVSQREKMPLLLGLLRREAAAASRGEPLRTLLFVNTKRFAERLVGTLERHGWKIGALTGDIPQARRLKILADFKNGTLPLLVATDVASRGLHIEGVTHVINVDLPQDPEDYVHRIGRTARAGRTGKAISLADEDYVFSLDAIQKLIGMKIPVEFADDKLFAPPGAAPAAPPRISSRGKEGREDGGCAAGDLCEARRRVGAFGAEDSSKVEEETAPPAPRSLRWRGRAASKPEPVTPRAPEAPTPSTFVEIPVSLPSSLEESSSGSPAILFALDFWTREAFGLEAPEGGFGADLPEPPPPGAAGPPAKRRRRRRGRRVAPPRGGGRSGLSADAVRGHRRTPPLLRGRGRGRDGRPRARLVREPRHPRGARDRDLLGLPRDPLRPARPRPFRGRARAARLSPRKRPRSPRSSTGSRPRRRTSSPTTTAPRSRSSSRSTSRPGPCRSSSSRRRSRGSGGRRRRGPRGATFSRPTRGTRGRPSRRSGSRRGSSTSRASTRWRFERLEDIYETARLSGGSLERPAHAGPVQAQRLGEIRARTVDPRGRPRGEGPPALRLRARARHRRRRRHRHPRGRALPPHGGPPPRHAAADGLLHSRPEIER